MQKFFHIKKRTQSKVAFYKTNNLHVQLHIRDISPVLHVPEVDRLHQGATP